MKKITKKDVFKIMTLSGKKRFLSLNDFISYLNHSQSALVEYITYIEEGFSENDRDFFLMTVMLAWQVIESIKKIKHVISYDALDFQLLKNLSRAQSFSNKKNEPERGIMECYCDDNNQKIFMDFIVDMLNSSMSFHQRFSGEKADELKKCRMIIHLKTVIDTMVLSSDEILKDYKKRSYTINDQEFVDALIDTYIDQFYHSSFHEDLKKYEKEYSSHIISSYGKYMYSKFLLFPYEWNVNRSLDVCDLIEPHESVDSENFYRSIEEVLKSFFAFIEDEGYCIAARHINEALSDLTDQTLIKMKKEKIV